MRWLVGISAIAFFTAIFLSLYQDDVGGGSQAGPNPYSESAIGYRALVNFLQQLDVPVVVSRNQSLLDRVSSEGFNVILEPPSSIGFEDLIFDYLGGGPVLLVLPKWETIADHENPRWVREVEPVDVNRVAAILNMVVNDGQIIRPGQAVAWTSSVFSATPAATLPQLMTSSEMTPLVESNEGILLGFHESFGVDFYVLSDPDILNNHGLGEADNALFAAELTDLLRVGEGAVMIDATLHGFTRSTNLWRNLFEVPFLPITMLGLALILAIFWAGSVRFGAPLPTPKVLQPGKQGLIDNTARLLDFGGNFQIILTDYWAASTRRVATGLHAPKSIEGVDLGPWFDRIAEARGLDRRYAHLQAEINTLTSTSNAELRRLFAAAQDIHRWKKEMLRGSRTD